VAAGLPSIVYSLGAAAKSRSRVTLEDMPGEIKVQLRQVSASTSEAAIRRHRVPIDRPEAKGGADAGPMGGELFLGAIGGCFMSNLLAAIKARDAEVSDVQIEVTGIVADTPARFSAVELLVTAEGANQDLLERLITIADRGCIMMNTLRGKLDVTVRASENISRTA
jgi:putative redox protein